MKIIEAMRKIKDLTRKAEDLRGKVGKYCADYSHQEPVYLDQKSQVTEWLQAHSDVLKEISRLRIAIQKTNLETNVDIEIGGQTVTKCIAGWIHRRVDLANHEKVAWAALKGSLLKINGMEMGVAKDKDGKDIPTKVRRYYDPKTRDAKVEEFTSEPSLINGRLEVVNAVTDILE